MSKAIIYTSVFLLILASVFLGVGIKTDDSKGIFTNLGTEIMGIVITLLFVDRIIDCNEKKTKERAWTEVKTKLSDMLYTFQNYLITDIRDMLNIDLDEMFGQNYLVEEFVSDPKVNSAYHESFEEYISPRIYCIFNKGNEEKYDFLIQDIQQIKNSLINFQSAYNFSLSPDVIAVIIELERLINNCLNFNIQARSALFSVKENHPFKSMEDYYKNKPLLRKQITEFILQIESKINEVSDMIK